MNGFGYPRYYFDFEGIDLAVPRWTGVRPYEQIPFQWSCHIERAPGKLNTLNFSICLVTTHRCHVSTACGRPSIPTTAVRSSSTTRLTSGKG